MDWPTVFMRRQEFAKRGSRNALSPIVSPYPVRNEALAVLFPAADVARGPITDEYRSRFIVAVSENDPMPM